MKRENTFKLVTYNRQMNVRQLGSLRPRDHLGKCYMDERIQYLSNASQHVGLPICLQPFLRYSGISVASDWFSTVLVSE